MMVSNKRICIFVPKKTGVLKGYDVLFIPYLFLKYKITIVLF
jgi:hypothetical protein